MKSDKIAIMYDFDKTLSPKDMQEFSYFNQIGTNPEEFWSLANKVSASEKMDPILTYMLMMIKFTPNLTKEDLNESGKAIELFPGVETWFNRINKYGDENDIEIEHYIISSGLQEMIEGTSIKDEFKKIYACRYVYNDQGSAIWPARVVNYTTKTQYIFRINKGVLDESNDIDLNKSTPEETKPIPYERMIYIGDGYTDVPSMKVVSQYGGYTIAVYKDDKSRDELAGQLYHDKRAQFLINADYSENSEMEIVVKSIIDVISKNIILDNYK